MEPGIAGVDEVGGRDIKVVVDRILEGQEDITGGSEGDGGGGVNSHWARRRMKKKSSTIGETRGSWR